MEPIEKSTLGFLILQPQFLKTDGLSSSDFSGKSKQIFNALADLWEETEGADITILQNKLNGKIRADELADLVTGVQKTNPDNFSNLVRELKKRTLRNRFCVRLTRWPKPGTLSLTKPRNF